MSLPVSALSARQSSAFERCAALAASRGLLVLWRGSAKVAPFVGCPAWGVSSSRPGHGAHIVWLYRGHLLCSCEAGRNERAITCSHAACVRLSLAQAAAVPASVPTDYSHSHSSAVAVVVVAGEAGEEPPSSDLRLDAHCQRCGFPVDADELAQLGGECLDCLLDMRSHQVRDAERKHSAQAAIIAREQERQASYRREGRHAGNDARRDPDWIAATEPETTEPPQDERERRETAPLARPAFSLFKA